MSSSTSSRATRIETAYIYGNVQVLQSDYVPVTFSDHLSYNVSINIEDDVKKFVLPKAKPFFKISPAVVDDSVFQEDLETSFNHWCLLRSRFQYPLLDWWEVTVKPSVRKLALER